jgi:hypothetical protein
MYHNILYCPYTNLHFECLQLNDSWFFDFDQFHSDLTMPVASAEKNNNKRNSQ